MLKDKIEEALSRLLKFNKIDQLQYNIFLDHYLKRNDEEKVLDELLKMFTETNFVSQKLSDILNSKVITHDVDNFGTGNFEPALSNMESYDINIIDVDDGVYSSRTGIIPIDEIKSENEGQSKGKQKTLSAHPGIHFGEDNGFIAILSILFLAGISCGIIFMIILNFIA